LINLSLNKYKFNFGDNYYLKSTKKLKYLILKNKFAIKMFRKAKDDIIYDSIKFENGDEYNG